MKVSGVEVETPCILFSLVCACGDKYERVRGKYGSMGEPPRTAFSTCVVKCSLRTPRGILKQRLLNYTARCSNITLIMKQFPRPLFRPKTLKKHRRSLSFSFTNFTIIRSSPISQLSCGLLFFIMRRWTGGWLL